MSTGAISTGGPMRLRNAAWRAWSVFYKRAVRPVMPVRRRLRYAGISVGLDQRIGDALVLPRLHNPPPFEDVDAYEEALITALRSSVKSGDTVVVVGGGLGVTVAIAAQLAGPNGSVTCYEGDAAGARRVRDTARRNGVAARVRVENAIVGENIGVWGREPAKRIVAPHMLPRCDVLELDCEGAELQILQGLTTLPRVVAVETHGFRGASTARVRATLEGRGYRVRDLGWAEPRLARTCSERDIRVVVAEQP